MCSILVYNADLYNRRYIYYGKPWLIESGLPPVPILVGGALYLVGILAEVISETQRQRFKQDPDKKGYLLYRRTLFACSACQLWRLHPVESGILSSHGMMGLRSYGWRVVFLRICFKSHPGSG